MDDQVDRYLRNVEQNRLDTLRKKLPEEHFIAVIKTAFELVPGVGGALSTLIDEYYPNRQIERLISFVEDLGHRLGWLEQQIKQERIRTEEFGDLLFDTLRLVSRDHRQEKLEAYRAILLNELIAPETIAGESEFFMTLVRDLSVPHIQMLRVFHQPHKSVSDDIQFTGQGGKYETTVQSALHRIFANAPAGYVDAIWTGLVTRGLVTDSLYRQVHKIDQRLAPGKVTDFSRWVFEHLSSVLTPFGRRFLQFITEPQGIDERGKA